jgi:hypothetical protein
MRHNSWLSILPMLVAATVAAQDNPDFAGRWVLETSADAGPDVALFLTVRQPVVRTNVYGAPMPPYLKSSQLNGSSATTCVSRPIRLVSREAWSEWLQRIAERHRT